MASSNDVTTININKAQSILCYFYRHMWQGPHGWAVAQHLKERVWLDYHLSTTWAQLMSVQGYNTFIHTRLLGNKWQYENDPSDVIGECTEFIWNNKVTTTEWLQLAQQWKMICCVVSFCWCCYTHVTLTGWACVAIFHTTVHVQFYATQWAHQWWQRSSGLIISVIQAHSEQSNFGEDLPVPSYQWFPLMMVRHQLNSLLVSFS